MGLHVRFSEQRALISLKITLRGVINRVSKRRLGIYRALLVDDWLLRILQESKIVGLCGLNRSVKECASYPKFLFLQLFRVTKKFLPIDTI